MSAAAEVTSAVGSGAEHLVLSLLYQLIAIFAVTRIVVFASNRWLGQTDAAGEILAGLLLGPSLLGAFFPATMHALFTPITGSALTCIAQVGLVLLMFQIGLEFRFKETLARSKHVVLAVSLAGIAVPFALGLLTAPWFLDQMPGQHRPDALSFRLFFAVALSITAIPVLGRIFMELGVSHTRVAALTIGAAAIDDVSGWLILGVIAALIAFNFDALEFGVRIVLLGAYVAAVLLLVRPALQRWLRRSMLQQGQLDNRTIGLLLVLLFVSAAVTSNLGVFAIIGGFVLGAALHDDRSFVEQWQMRVGSLVNTLFLPIFFAFTGLRTDATSLAGDAWLQCLAIIAIAFVGKFGGTFVAARLMGESPRDALTIGVCMNTRALMELIALNIGYDLGVLPKPIFTMLVIMAIASTFIATPLIRRLLREERSPGQAAASLRYAA